MMKRIFAITELLNVKVMYFYKDKLFKEKTNFFAMTYEAK